MRASLSVFILARDLSFDCSSVLDYEKLRTVLQSSGQGPPGHRLRLTKSHKFFKIIFGMLNILILCRVSFVHRCLGIYGNKLQLKLNANISFNNCPVILKVHCTYLHLTFVRLKAIT